MAPSKKMAANRSNTVPTKSPRALVVGGGPAGALCAKGLADKGLTVTLCEAYPHPSSTLRGNKAYCIVLSPRGQRALQKWNINPMSVPGACKCITLARHSPKGIGTREHPEHPSVVVSRKSLAGYLLDQASEAGVDVRLQHELTGIDFENKIATFQTDNRGVIITVEYDLVVGCDGSNSIVRTLLALKQSDLFQVRMETDTMEYQVAVLKQPFQDIAVNKTEAAPIPRESVHSWNNRSANSLCLGFPHEEGGLLFTIIYPGGKLNEMKENDSYEEELSLLLPDITPQARSAIIEQLKQGKPSSGGTCVWPSFLGSASDGVVLVGDSGHAMFPSLGQGANCALESAAIFCDTVSDISINETDWPQKLAIEYNSRRYQDATAAVTLTYRGMGGTKTRHAKNASVLFMLQIGVMMLLHKITCGLVPQPAMLRLMFGEDESYSYLAKDHLVYEPQKLLLVGLAVIIPIGSYLYTKLTS